MERPVASEPHHGAARAAWLALALALARGGVVGALEVAHHGEPRLASLRLAAVATESVVQAALLGLAAACARNRFSRNRSGRVALAALLVGVVALFLAGQLQHERSLRIGTETGLGWTANAVVLAASLALAAAFVWGRALPAPLAGWCGVCAPLVLLVLAPPILRAGARGAHEAMSVRATELDLVAARWEAVRARADAPPGPALLAPAAEFDAEAAAQPALVLAPPARVRTSLDEFEGVRWLVGSAGIEHAGRSTLAARYPGHVLALRVFVDGARASEVRLPLEGDPTWRPLGRKGVAVRGGARVELESALLDREGLEVRPAEPIRVGLGGLAVERRERIPRARSGPESPNVVLIVLDTLRADRTSAYGYARPTTPHLAALAERGVLFEEVSATASWTWPSTASLLTGLYPAEHGVEDAANSFLAQALDTLPEALQRLGFTTAAWSGSPLIVPDKGFGQGFEFFDASREGRLRRSDLFVPAALEWLGTLRGARFFLYLHLMEPHAPSVPLREGRRQFAADVPADYDPWRAVAHNWELQSSGFDPDGSPRTESVVPADEQRWISDLYDACVWSADDWLGRVLARLEELGLCDETIVAVTSDHGEELFDHGLLSHGNTLHRELVRVPLVLAGPGVPVGARVATPLSGVAVAPTLARLAGARLMGLEDARDLLNTTGAEPQLFSTRQGWWNGYAQQPLFGLRRGTSVLHVAPEGAPWGAGARRGPGEVRLYDLALDPLETRDLAREEPARAAELRAELERLLSGFRARSLPAVEADPGTLERLRGLGYVGDEDAEGR
jgi:arylsulfatase A-like enzyme